MPMSMASLSSLLFVKNAQDISILRRSTEILKFIQDMALYEHVEIDLERQITVFKLAIHYKAYASGNKHCGTKEIY